MSSVGSDNIMASHPSAYASGAWSADQHLRCVELVVKARKYGVFSEVMKDVEQTELSVLSTGGSMTDAAKRARSSDDESFEVIPKYGPSPSTTAAPYPSSPTEAFPAGITSMKDWGENLVAFGKFKNKLTYYQLFSGTSDELVSYRAYVHSHRLAGSPALVDLAKYCERMGYSPGEDRNQGPVIPGSSIRRQK